ncbi:MAG: efflux RND transporter permease subunit [Gammaproteobacteria bacterium]
MFNITRFALDNSRLVIVVIILIAGGGVYLYQDFPRLEDPSITIREAVVAAKYPGMPPERIERLITRPIEEKVRTVGEVDDIKKSTSKFGEMLLHVTIKDEVPSENLPAVWKLLRNRMDDLRPYLPKGTLGPIVNDEFGDTAVATIALWSEGFSMAEMYEVARSAREQLSSLKGIKKVILSGVQNQRIYLNFSNAKIAQYGLEPQLVTRTLESQNVILPSGRIDVQGTDILVEPSGRFRSIEDIREVLIPVGDGRVVALADIATIEKGYVDPPEKPVYFNGKPAIILSVFLLEQVNAVSFGERLTKKIREIEASLPWGYVFEYATYQPDLIQSAVDNMVINVIETVVIVLVVVILFLGLRTGLIVGSFVPLVMLFGLVMMAVFKIEMQRMSLATMIIALGMLVDNGIVMAEDIRTRMEQGTERREAILQAGDSLTIPLLTSTLTTVFAFLPMILMEGSTGDYTKSLGQVVAILLIGSWFFSVFVTPTTCFWFLKVEPPKGGKVGTQNDPYQAKFYKVYRRVLETALKRRFLVLLGAVGALALALYGFTFVAKIFFPGGDRNQYLIYLDMPAGTRIERNDQTVRAISEWLNDKEANPEITSSVAFVGDGGPRFFLSLSPNDPEPYNSFFIVNTENSTQVEEMVERTRDHLLEQFPEVRARVKSMWLGASETGLFEIRFSGPDIALLQRQAEAMMTALRALPGSLDVRQDWDNPVVKLTVDVDQARARRSEVSSQQVADILNGFLFGKTLTHFWFGDIEIPVVARGVEMERTAGAGLRDLNIFSLKNPNGVPLSQIATIRGVGEYSKIMRHNQERTITVGAKNRTLAATQIFEAVKPALASMEFPAQHGWHLGAELEDSGKAQKKLSKWFPFCFLLIVGLLIWQFNSFRRAGIIVITIPLIMIGAVIGMLVMRADFGFMVILGLLSLAGTIINNGIVMIDRIESLKAEGNSPYDAVIGSAVSRFRPIMLSVTTTVLGLLPLIVSHDPLFYGLACVMAFGLMVGTVFTLGIVPVLYTLFFRISAVGQRPR